VVINVLNIRSDMRYEEGTSFELEVSRTRTTGSLGLLPWDTVSLRALAFQVLHDELINTMIRLHFFWLRCSGCKPEMLRKKIPAAN